LQEVTLNFYPDIFKEEFFRDYYISGNSIKESSILILSKIPCKMYEYIYPTKMDRKLFYCEVHINGKKAVFATAHQESLIEN
jgi:hypothetical protein